MMCVWPGPVGKRTVRFGVLEESTRQKQQHKVGGLFELFFLNGSFTDSMLYCVLLLFMSLSSSSWCASLFFTVFVGRRGAMMMMCAMVCLSRLFLFVPNRNIFPPCPNAELSARWRPRPKRRRKFFCSLYFIFSSQFFRSAGVFLARAILSRIPPPAIPDSHGSSLCDRSMSLLFLSSPSVAPCKSRHLHRALLLNCNFRTKDSLWIYKLYKSRNKMYENQHNLGCRLSFVSWMDLHTFYYWCDAMLPLSSGLVLRLCTKSANNPERVQHKNYIKKQSHRVFFIWEFQHFFFIFFIFLCT